MQCERREADHANRLDRDAIGKRVDLGEGNTAADLQRLCHAVGTRRLDADDLNRWLECLDVDGDAGDEAAAADRHEDRVEVLHLSPQLLQDFCANCALPCMNTPQPWPRIEARWPRARTSALAAAAQPDTGPAERRGTAGRMALGLRPQLW